MTRMLAIWFFLGGGDAAGISQSLLGIPRLNAGMGPDPNAAIMRN